MTCRELADILMETPDYEVRKAFELRGHGEGGILTQLEISVTRFHQLAEVVFGNCNVSEMEPRYQPQPVDDPIERALKSGSPEKRLAAVFAKAMDSYARELLDKP